MELAPCGVFGSVATPPTASPAWMRARVLRVSALLSSVSAAGRARRSGRGPSRRRSKASIMSSARAIIWASATQAASRSAHRAQRLPAIPKARVEAPRQRRGLAASSVGAPACQPRTAPAPGAETGALRRSALPNVVLGLRAPVLECGRTRQGGGWAAGRGFGALRGGKACLLGGLRLRPLPRRQCPHIAPPRGRRRASLIECIPAAQVLLTGPLVDANKKKGLVGSGTVELIAVKNQLVLRFRGLNVPNLFNHDLAVFWSDGDAKGGRVPQKAHVHRLPLDRGLNSLLRGSLEDPSSAGADDEGSSPQTQRRSKRLRRRRSLAAGDGEEEQAADTAGSLPGGAPKSRVEKPKDRDMQRDIRPAMASQSRDLFGIKLVTGGDVRHMRSVLIAKARARTHRPAPCRSHAPRPLPSRRRRSRVGSTSCTAGRAWASTGDPHERTRAHAWRVSTQSACIRLRCACRAERPRSSKSASTLAKCFRSWCVPPATGPAASGRPCLRSVLALTFVTVSPLAGRGPERNH